MLAVPCLAAFGVLRTMVDRLTIRGSLIAEEMLLSLKPQEQKALTDARRLGRGVSAPSAETRAAMRRNRMPDMKEGGVNVTPLIDIVMCLIIFFMLVARIGVSTGADSTIAVPDTIRGSRIDDLGNTLTLNVRTGVGGNPLVTVLSHGQFTEVGAGREPRWQNGLPPGGSAS